MSRDISERSNRASQFVGFVLVEASAVNPFDAPGQVHDLRTNDERDRAVVERHAEDGTASVQTHHVLFDLAGVERLDNLQGRHVVALHLAWVYA